MIKGITCVSKYLDVRTNNIAAEAHLAEGKVLLEEQTLNKEKASDIPSKKSRTSSFQ
jgi:hypothetical protein